MEMFTWPLSDFSFLRRKNEVDVSSLTCIVCELYKKGFLGRTIFGSDWLTQGSKKPPSGCPGQVDCPFGQVTFSPSLPHGQGPRQAVR